MNDAIAERIAIALERLADSADEARHGEAVRHEENQAERGARAAVHDAQQDAIAAAIRDVAYATGGNAR